MTQNKIIKKTPVRLAIGIVLGLFIGLLTLTLSQAARDVIEQTLLLIRQFVSQIILFIVPLIILGCIAPSIARFKGNTVKLLLVTFGIAYLSSILAAILSITISYHLIPLNNFSLPDAIEEPAKCFYNLKIPTLATSSALLLSIIVGLGSVWIRSNRLESFLKEMQSMILEIVRRVLIPLLPFFVGASFALLAIQGQLGKLTIFVPAIAIIVVLQVIWIAFTYIMAGIYSRKKSWEILRLYPKATWTAFTTMSSAATLPVALDCIHKSPHISKETADFTIPLFSNIHLCGSVIAEMCLVVTAYYAFFGLLPSYSTMLLFAFLACIIAIGSPGVPGGLNVSCQQLLFTIVIVAETQELADNIFAIMTAVYALVDCCGTACNVTCDGALTLITESYLKRINSK